jgi:hypothetical protein
MLNELDKELESRGLRFVRYVDDVVIFVKSKMSARRVLSSITKFIEARLDFIVNGTKTKITKPHDPKLKFLEFGFYKDRQAGAYKAKLHQQSVKISNRLTRKNWSVDTNYQVVIINQLIRGWIN